MKYYANNCHTGILASLEYAHHMIEGCSKNNVICALFRGNGAKRAENVPEIRAYIKGRSLHGIKAVDIHRNVLKTDALFTVRQLARMTNLLSARVHAILKKHLKVRKINARWIPHLLTDDQKRVTVAKKLLKMYQKYSKKAFDNIVTGDETWVYYFESKRKVANRLWANKNARCPSIVKQIRTVRKVLYAIFSLIRVQLFESRCQKAERHRQVP